jgi:hypothetical protein
MIEYNFNIEVQIQVKSLVTLITLHVHPTPDTSQLPECMSIKKCMLLQSFRSVSASLPVDESTSPVLALLAIGHVFVQVEKEMSPSQLSDAIINVDI